MTKEDDDFLKRSKELQETADKAVSKDPDRYNYCILLRKPEQDKVEDSAVYLMSPFEETAYTIYYDPHSLLPLEKMSGDHVYYCKTWTEVEDIVKFLLEHPEMFNEPLPTLDDATDAVSYVSNVDEYLDNNTDYDTSMLYDDYDIE